MIVPVEREIIRVAGFGEDSEGNQTFEEVTTSVSDISLSGFGVREVNSVERKRKRAKRNQSHSDSRFDLSN